MGGPTLGQEGHLPPDSLVDPQIQKLAGKMWAYTEFVFFRCQSTNKMDSVMKGLRGDAPLRATG